MISLDNATDVVTPTLILRELEPEDMAFVNAWRNDPVVMATLGSAFQFVSEAVDADWYARYRAHRDTEMRLAICVDSASPELPGIIGNVNLTRIHPIHRTAEFSIVIADSRFRGLGLGRQATLTVLQHAFDTLNLNRIELTVLADNASAIRLYQSVGFTIEGRLREALYKQGAYVDVLHMALLRSEFTEVL